MFRPPAPRQSRRRSAFRAGRLTTALLTSVALFTPTTSFSQSAESRAIWNRPASPFRLYGEIYYVGTAGLSAFLINTPAGLILIDGGLPESAPLIARNVEQLGFSLADIKYLLINHAHTDHAGGLAELKRRTGASLVAGARDRAILETGVLPGRPEIVPFPAVQVDGVVSDGDTISLGGSVITAIATPGHTPGATSWVLTTAGKRVLFLSSISVGGQNLIDDPNYPEAAADFRRTFARLKSQEVDLVVGFHAEAFDLDAKRARLEAGKTDAFVDRSELARQLSRAETAYNGTLRAQSMERSGP